MWMCSSYLCSVLCIQTCGHHFLNWKLNVRCSCFCKPRLFSHQQIHQYHECGFAIIAPTTTNLHERPSTTRWFVGSRVELITFKIFAIYSVGQTIERAFFELWRGNKITILKWSHQSWIGPSRPKNKAKFSAKVNSDWKALCRWTNIIFNWNKFSVSKFCVTIRAVELEIGIRKQPFGGVIYKRAVK